MRPRGRRRSPNRPRHDARRNRFPTVRCRPERGTGGCSSAGWHRSASNACASPNTHVIWSITPHGAPATRFSAVWHRSARSRGSSAMPKAHAAACMVAVSTAADELTPFPSGTCDAITTLAPDGSGSASLAREDENDADDVGRPLKRALCEHPPCLVVAQRAAAGASVCSGIVYGRPAEADDFEDGAIEPLNGRPRCLRDRALQHERPE